MHLGNSIICPVTAVPMIAATGAAAFFAFKNARKDFTREKIAPTILLTLFVFALQMINFSIPSTGSSGHIIGAILLSIILGPSVAFLSITSILIVQALFFADGGIMALGCNIFNMGVLACFVAYPLIYKPLENKNQFLGAVLASVAALQLGSIAVAAESTLSGSINSNIALFAALMMGIHLIIGIVEGIFTAIAVRFSSKKIFNKAFNYFIGLITVILAGVISNYASSKPDGLEWSLINVSDSFVAQTNGVFYQISESLQADLAYLANLPASAANITGLMILALMMFVLCSYLSYKKAY